MSLEIGSVYNRLTVVSFNGYKIDSYGDRIPYWDCVCSCGKPVTLNQYQFTRNTSPTKSCGCLQREVVSANSTKHGRYGSPTHFSWQTMKQRCQNPNAPEYEMYGGGGVTICARWLEKGYKGFINFLEDMGERPEGTSLNRINGAKLYSKETCEWATLSVQAFDQTIMSNNTSGVTGVYFVKKNNCWNAKISKECVNYNLGYFKTKEEAIEVRLAAELKYYGRYKNDGRQADNKAILQISS